MPKIMLVEDDNNLREIYGERLMAEGYEIVSASDGEEALALAVKEKPDLIISDVMMPKISGFDMLDILRQTPETKDTKVIMMTALSQTEDKDRADRLGADKYLVKSQVTLEDVARVVHDLVYGPEESSANEEQQPAPEPTIVPSSTMATPPELVTSQTPVFADPLATPPSTIPTTSDTNQASPSATASFQSAQPDNTTQPTTQPSATTEVTAPEPLATPVAVAPEPLLPTTSAASQPLTEPIIGQQSVPSTDQPVINGTPTTASQPPQAQVATQTPEPTVPTTPTESTFSTTTPELPTTVTAQTPTPTSYDLITSKSNSTPRPEQTPNPTVSETSFNPIMGEQTQSPNTYGVPTVVSSADAQTADDELAAIAKQLANFTSEDPAETKQHQEPLVEPKDQAPDNVQNGDQGLSVVSNNPIEPNTTDQPTSTAQPVDPTVPPIIANSNSDDNSLEPAGVRKKVITPLNGIGDTAPSIYELYEKEMAEEAANTPITNPSAGNSVAAVADNNPITKPDNTGIPSALETIDVSQIDGVTVGDELPLEEPIVQTPPEQTTATPPAQPPSTPPPASPNDPNSIAL